MLEDLSARFIASGWSLKWLHREIMLSAACRQSSHPRADAMEADPTNTYVWRMNPHRLDIEAYRDSILEASGKLDLTFVRAFCGQREGYAAHQIVERRGVRDDDQWRARRLFSRSETRSSIVYSRKIECRFRKPSTSSRDVKPRSLRS